MGNKKKDVPLEVIERWLRDSDCVVRAAAMNACAANGIDLPVSRTFNPPKRVYKKCLCDVIVVAEIPKDAHVRGAKGQKCRASKARIVEVRGDVCGEPVGISSYDKKTTYYQGDEIEIDDFDLSSNECSTGFHFFCTLKEAKDFEL